MLVTILDESKKGKEKDDNDEDEGKKHENMNLYVESGKWMLIPKT